MESPREPSCQVASSETPEASPDADKSSSSLLTNAITCLASYQEVSNTKCPICGSANIKKITMTTRAVKTAAFGVIRAVNDAVKNI